MKTETEIHDSKMCGASEQISDKDAKIGEQQEQIANLTRELEEEKRNSSEPGHALAIVLASSCPNPRDHPIMSVAWQLGQSALAEYRANQAKREG